MLTATKKPVNRWGSLLTQCMTGVVARRMMRLRHTSLATALIVLFASVGYPQTPVTNRDSQIPDFSVQVWGYIMTDFSTRVWSYFELRTKLEEGIPALTVTDDPAEIRRSERALARKIRVARAGAKQGEIFTPTISGEFRKILLLEMNANTWAAIRDDNPGEFSHHINGTYPKRKALSTVPPNILAVLPRLPDDIQYRFLGRHLILHDTRANVILDRIPYAIQCADCDEWTCCPHEYRHRKGRAISQAETRVADKVTRYQWCKASRNPMRSNQGGPPMQIPIDFVIRSGSAGTTRSLRESKSAT